MTFESSLSKVKQIPNADQLIVFGYIHEMESILHKLNDASAYYNIPDLVTLAVLCYYYHFIHFKDHGKKINISGHNDNIATMAFNHVSANTAYIGNAINSLNNKVITCKIELRSPYSFSKSLSHLFTTLFGITSADNALNKAFLYDWNQWTYCMESNAGTCYINSMNGADKMWTTPKQCPELSCEDGDTLRLVWNIPKGIISFSRNDEDMVVCFDNIARKQDVEYTFVVAMYDKGQSVEILEYTEQILTD